MHDQITNNEVVRDQWNKGVVPKFPFYHGINTLGTLSLIQKTTFCIKNHKKHLYLSKSINLISIFIIQNRKIVIIEK